MATPKEHIEEIRGSKFSIGGTLNPLTEDLHQAVKNLSAELYAKDVHFLMELIQNAEDNQYDEGVDPSLEFIITSKDITATGAPATLLILNNEKGFSSKNIDSICSVGRSTKKGNRRSGYIGEKGIGFKSVFLITATPYIFSNGYQIRFNEEPCPHCGLGYIVPEWVDENPTLHDIQQICGVRDSDSLPTTTIVLPLKKDKVKPVKHQLSTIHPEVLLFLSKIRRLAVREVNEDPRLNSVSAVSISSETDLKTRKNMNAESYTLHLSAEENGGSDEECMYHMWKQRFPVRPENRVDRRMDVEEWVITLAFPNQERLNRGRSSPGIYAFLPTEMVTDFPFIIQADFVLASSRESILLDDKWNQGILNCVPSAFMDAFKSVVIAMEDAPVSSLPRFFKFLPVKSSSYEVLNGVRETIRAKLVEENIVPIETYTKQKHFKKPGEVSRLLPAFWDILAKAREQGVQLHNLSSHGSYILSSSFDQAQYNQILDFLGVQLVSNNWYAKCIQSSNLVMGVSEDAYLQLLLFIAKHWESRFSGSNSNMKNIQLIKYVGSDGNESFFNLSVCSRYNGGNSILLANQNTAVPWLIDWNKEFRCAGNRYFMPESTQKAIQIFPKNQTLLEWLKKEVNVSTLSVYSYAKLISISINSDRPLALAYAHFLYHSSNFFSLSEVEDLCSSMPLIDNYGGVAACRVGVLMPANVSKWADLIVSNPWRAEGYVELSEDYLHSRQYAGQSSRDKELLNFLKTRVGASDIPDISPPNAGFSAVNTPLTKENAFLLLEWIRKLKYKGVLPGRFLKSIREGSWLKVTVNGYRSPSQSFLIGSSLGSLLQNGSVLVDIPLVDQSFYGDRIFKYEEELKTVGVMFEYGEACEFIGKELMSRAASFTLSRGQVLSVLQFMRYLRRSLLPLDHFVSSIKKGSWLKTSRGYMCPVGSVLFDSEWQTASQISDIPFIDRSYYGEEIYDFKVELLLLGVKVGFNASYQHVIDHFKSTSYLSHLTPEAVILILECLHFVDASSKLVDALKGTKCLKTKMGYNAPGECYLPDPVWGCILEVFSGFPVIDREFYGNKILTYRNDLKKMGVVVDFEDAIKAFGTAFKQKASQTSLTKQHVESFLSCYRRLKEAKYDFPKEFSSVLTTAKWLRTRLADYRPPKDCILFGPEWESLSPITRLPFIDDSDNFYGDGIHEYKEELKRMGVITELRHGLKFVTTSLRFPRDPTSITPENVFSLLECIRFMQESYQSFDDDFKERLSRNWLKTHVGYLPPDQCLWFDSEWEYLRKYEWKPEKEADKKVWIPKGEDGEWVNSEECVIHDKDDLFGSRLNVLERHYEKKLLPFFSSAMDVKYNPSVDDYMELWKDWESSEEHFSLGKCCKFWNFILQHWGLKTQKKVGDRLKKLPAASGADGIVLLDRFDVFVADNLHLKNLFEEEKVFVWLPEPSLAPIERSKLLDIYREIGVRPISESVEKEESSILDGVKLKQVDARSIFIGKGLIKLILSFLACSSLKLEVEKRHKAVEGLINLTVYEMIEPISVRYSLSLSSGDVITKEANKMIRWESGSSKLFTQQMDLNSGNAARIKYATYFSEAISVGVLCENVDHVHALSELIKLAFLLKFEEEAVDFLMESKDLQIFLEDESFLKCAFQSN
ncbi:ATP/DNA-binding protein [Senna tora]|uniref:ATP/DNA-binding protein n=1 Tax=Senna tora TaxID=362788 RepID=A0A835C9E5_9FABA|nr:ATP/DNA-binding protein [Senna tora]